MVETSRIWRGVFVCSWQKLWLFFFYDKYEKISKRYHPPPGNMAGLSKI